MKLTGSELRQIREILGNSAQLQASDKRRSFLILCDGLEKHLGLIKFEGSFEDFFNELYAKLLGVIEKEKKSGFAIFLEWFVELDQSLIYENKIIIEDAIKKLNSVKSSTIPQKKNQIKEQLNRGRQTSTQQKQKRKKSIKIDQNEIIKYDLVELVSRFKEKMISYKGTFAFLLANYDSSLLEKYIIKRIVCELEEHTQQRLNKVFEVSLYCNTILNYQDIENCFHKKYQCNCITNVFENQKNTDIILIIWNYNIPLENMQKLAQTFWTEISPRVQPFVDREKCFFVLIWANVCMINFSKNLLEEFTVLPIPEKFDFPSLEAWFNGLLRTRKVADPQIKYYLDRLERQGGHLVGTFREMNQIIRELQGGCQLYG